MIDLAFVPRKSVPIWRLKGYAPVPGNPTPSGWAILMQKVADQPVEAPEPIPAHCTKYRSNKSRGASMANAARYGRVPA